MSSIRNLKKDINYLTNELLAECYTYSRFHAAGENTKVEEITHAIIRKRNEIVYKMYHYDKSKGSKTPKEHYKQIMKECGEMVSLLDSLKELKTK